MPEPNALSAATPAPLTRLDGIGTKGAEHRTCEQRRGPSALWEGTATATCVEHDVIYDELELTDNGSDQYHSRERTNG